MTGIAAPITETTPFELPPDTISQDDAIFDAARADRTHRVFPCEHEHYRTWLMSGPHGSVTIHDAGNGWAQIVLVDMRSQGEELIFWNRLAARVSENPDEAQVAEPGFITRLLAEAGLYNPDLLLNG